MQKDEFSVSVETSGLKLTEQGVVIVWEWNWDDSDSTSDVDHVSESSVEADSDDEHNPYIDSETDEADTTVTETTVAETVTCKCIGTTHDSVGQKMLARAKTLMDQQECVPVKIEPEPDNQYDSKAIAFKCRVDEKWYRIGYIVKEALEDVHNALTQKLVVDVSFKWIKYLVIWMRSGPGYYAGINITINGKWSSQVHRCASTR